MRILIVHTHYTQEGGEDTVVRQEQKLLAAQHTVETLIFQNKSGAGGALQFLASAWNLSAAKRLRKKIRSFQPDIIHLHNWHFASGPLIIRTACRLRVPLVYTVHNYRLLCPSATLLHKGQIFMDSVQAGFPWQAVKRKVYRDSSFQTFWLAFVVWLHRKAGTWAMPSRYIFLTNSAADIFSNSRLKSVIKQYSIKPNFIYPQPVQATTRTANFLFVGRLSEEKGIHVMLEALEHADHSLWIAGDGPLAETVKEAARLNPRIVYLGKLNPEQVKERLRTCAALIFPSIWYEPFGMVLIEAFSLGCPVIASNIGSPLELVKQGKTGLLFDYGNARSLAATMDEWRNLLPDEKEKYYTTAADTFNSQYSPEANYRMLLQIYKDALKEQST